MDKSFQQSQNDKKCSSALKYILPIAQKKPYLLNNYKSGSKYALNNINSVLYRDGKIYNMFQQNTVKRSVKCGCVKSNCEAKYCQCYRWGQTCGDQCSCLDCKNKSIKKYKYTRQEQIGCNCIKSGCTKKYCECRQMGKKCGQYCKCSNCQNLQ